MNIEVLKSELSVLKKKGLWNLMDAVNEQDVLTDSEYSFTVDCLQALDESDSLKEWQELLTHLRNKLSRPEARNWCYRQVDY